VIQLVVVYVNKAKHIYFGSHIRSLIVAVFAMEVLAIGATTVGTGGDWSPTFRWANF